MWSRNIIRLVRRHRENEVSSGEVGHRQEGFTLTWGYFACNASCEDVFSSSVCLRDIWQFARGMMGAEVGLNIMLFSHLILGIGNIREADINVLAVQKPQSNKHASFIHNCYSPSSDWSLLSFWAISLNKRRLKHINQHSLSQNRSSVSFKWKFSRGLCDRVKTRKIIFFLDFPLYTHNH